MVLFVAIIAALLPIPLASSGTQNKKDLSRPFPCQNRPCGCRSAEQCEKKCCCFSPSQKLAWAKRNRVTSFDHSVVEMKRESLDSSSSRGCCSSKRGTKSPVQPVVNVNRSQKVAHGKETRVKIVIGVIAQQCQGVDQTLSGQSLFVVPPLLVLKTFIDSNGSRLIAREVRFENLFLEPPVPPPRVMNA